MKKDQTVPDTTGALDSIITQVAASYGRKSDDDSEGLRSQFLNNSQRAQLDGFCIPETFDYRFEDDDTIGTTKKREDLERLIAVVRSGEAPFKRVYVKDVTRLGRWSDPRYRFYLEVMFEEYGVEIVYAEKPEHISYGDELTPERMTRFISEAMENVVASQERDRLIRRVTGGMRYWVHRGYFPGGRAPYGLKRQLADEKTGVVVQDVPDGLTLRQSGCRYKLAWKNDGSRDVIRRVYSLVQQGLGLAAVARVLNNEGLGAPEGGEWTVEAVRRIARNPIYCGDLIWGRTTREGDPLPPEEATLNGRASMIVRDFVPNAPVSHEEWIEVQKVLDGHREAWSRRHATAPQYLLSGMIACHECGATWHGHTSTRAEKTRRRYYRHGAVPKERGRCSNLNRYVSAEHIEESALTILRGMVQDGDFQARVEAALEQRLEAASSADHERRQEMLEQQVDRLEGGIRQMKIDSALDTSELERKLTREAMAALLRQAEQARAELRLVGEERTRVEQMAKRTASVLRQATNLQRVFDAAGPDAQKQALALVVEQITVDANANVATVAVRAM